MTTNPNTAPLTPEHFRKIHHIDPPASAPLSPEREQEIREHVASMTNFSLGNLAARDLLTELDRVRAERDTWECRATVNQKIREENYRRADHFAAELSRVRAELDRYQTAYQSARQRAAGYWSGYEGERGLRMKREAELDDLQKRVDALRAERHSTNDALADITLARYVDADVLRVELASAQRQWEHWAREATALRERVAELEAERLREGQLAEQRHALLDLDPDSCCRPAGFVCPNACPAPELEATR